MLKKGFLEGKSFILQFGVLLLITLVSGVIITLLSFSFGAMLMGKEFYLSLMYGGQNTISYYATLWVLLFQHIGLFVVPAILYAYGFHEKSVHFWGFDRFIPFLSFILIFLIFMFFQFPVAWLHDINKNINLPASMASLEDQFKLWEESARQTLNFLASYPGWEGWILSFLLIALLPAISEELFFRGTLQNWLLRFTRPWIAILLVALIFSAFHFDFYGFLPRLALGLLLGYIFFKTGSLWSTMFIHFLNNGFAFIFKRLYLLGYMNIDLEDPSHFDVSWWVAILFTMITAVLLYYFHQMKYSHE